MNTTTTTPIQTPNGKCRWVRVIAIIALLAIIGFLVVPRLGLFGDENSASKANGAPAAPGPGGGRPQGPAQVVAQVVQVGQLNAPLTLAGTILPNERVEITSEVAGKIIQIGFSEGKRVAAGTLLAKLNDAELQAGLEKAKSRAKLAELDEHRKKALLDRDAISPAEYEVAVSELQVAKADIMLIEAQLAKTEIRAPFGGIIGLRKVSLGSYVTPSTVIATLQEIDPLKVEFSIPERYAASLRTGMIFNYKVDGVSSTRTARVYAIEPSLDERTRALRVRAFSNNPDGSIMPGQYAAVELKTGSSGSFPLVPTEAIVPTMQGQQVFLVKGGKAVAQDVKTGGRSEQRIEIVEGIQLGDTIVVSGVQALKDGSQVKATIQ